MDPLEPSAVLGGAVTSLKPKKKKNPVMKEGSHTESVLGLSWNRVYRPALASGSADATIKIWDVTTQQCSHTFAQHSDKVQTVQWHPSQAWLLSSGSFDKTVCLFDCRSASVCAVYSLPSDVEVRLIVLIMVSLLVCSHKLGILSTLICYTLQSRMARWYASMLAALVIH